MKPTPPLSDTKETVEDAVDKLAQTARDIVDRVAKAANDAAREAKPAIDRADQFAHNMVDKAAAGTANAADWLEGQANEFNIDKEKLVTDVRVYIQQNSLKAVGVAFAVGLLIARMIR
ncbi:MAG: hypothetical protein HY308_09200 [Gammaproteobacteria bacterium]|nr:hypothetical protein [Gammaproteobacteria bacterium]